MSKSTSRGAFRRSWAIRRTRTAQWGYLSALLAVAKEGLGQHMDATPFAEARELQETYRLTGK